jgi:hypothetical protein
MNFSKVTICALAVLSAVSLQACHREYHGGGHGHDHGGRWREPRWREPHHRPGHGGHHRPGRGGHHRGAFEAVASAENENMLSPAEAFAADYNVRLENAEKVIKFAADTDNDVARIALSVSREDVIELGNNRIPPRESIDRIANDLGESAATVEKIFADYVADMKSE